MAKSSPERRAIRSFVRRTGRLTASQNRALQEDWQRYGLQYDGNILDLDQVFGRSADKVLEIGFGNGESLVQAAEERPDLDFIGVEVHEPGVGHCILKAKERQLKNLRLIIHDAIDVLRDQIEDRALSRINLLFADPWPKKRHHKRRIVQESFLKLCASVFRPGGTLHIATDWGNYAEHIDETLDASDLFRLLQHRDHDGNQPLDRPGTKFERRGLAIGHRISDRVFEVIK